MKSVALENEIGGGWDVNPDLDLQQRTSLIHVLEEYADVFASNPKKPNTTHLIEHVIDTGDYLPAKSKNVRVSPHTEVDINTQMTQMLQYGIIKPSASHGRVELFW